MYLEGAPDRHEKEETFWTLKNFVDFFFLSPFSTFPGLFASSFFPFRGSQTMI
jgi:hypothetical protein